jgi:acetylornithine deacetylase/succinyl-diaminopimelate desuccinylase-like protein
LINLPSLNVRGMASSRTGDKASNVIPSSSTASIDIRLVKGLDGATTVRRVLDHVRKQGFEIVEAEPDAATRMQYARVARVTNVRGYNASRTSMDLPISNSFLSTAVPARADREAPDHGRQRAALYDRNPACAPFVPIANHDNNQPVSMRTSG